MRLTLDIWRQKDASDPGRFVRYQGKMLYERATRAAGLFP